MHLVPYYETSVIKISVFYVFMLLLSFSIFSDQCRGAFDLPESESGFEIMILIHRFI